MTPVVSRHTLLAVAIAAAIPTVASAVPADYTCVSSSGSATACEVANESYDSVNVDSGTVLNGTSIGLDHDNSSTDTLNNNGTISGSLYGLKNVNNSVIGTLNNYGTISATANFGTGLHVSFATLTTLNNSGTISGGQAMELQPFGPMTINNSGNILGGSATQYAINAQNAGNNVTLNWSGGLIRGGMRGVAAINVTGDVVYDTRYSYGNISLANAAKMTFEQDRVQHSGNLTLAPNAMLDLYLSSATPLASSGTPSNTAIVYGVSTATFGNGSQIGLKVRGADFAANQSTYTLLAGEGIVDNGLTVVTRDSALLRVDSFEVAGGSRVLATVSTVDDYAFIGNTPNGQRAGSAILPLLSGMAGGNNNDPVLNALAGDADEVARTVEQLVPQVNGASLQAANSLNNIANFNANQRTQGLRGASAGDAFIERGLWLKALGSDVTQDARDGIEGYDADLSGLAIGADGKLTDQLTLGLSYSYLNSDITADGGNQTDIDGHAITLYSGYEQGAWFLDSSLTLGLNHNDSTRYIAGTKAKGDYDSQLLGLDVLGGYGFNLDNGLLIEPRAAARYARVDIDSFREKGSIAALAVEDQRYEVAELGAGLRVAGDLPLGQGNLQPQATLMVYHDFAADQIATNASFTFGSSSFLATGASPARTRYEAGIGVDYVIANTTLGISYDYSGKEDFQADTLQAKVRYDF
jgi:outer membrane autotransporter protein